MRKLLLSIILLFCIRNVVLAGTFGVFTGTAFPAGTNFPGLKQSPWLTYSGVDFSYFEAAITSQPAAVAICAGSNAEFSLTATGAVSYQWQVDQGSGFSNIADGGVYSNATTNTLNITAAPAGMNNFKYRCVISGSSGPDITSSEAALQVFSAPLTFGLHPVNKTVCVGTATSFQVSAANASNFQWQANDGGGFVNISDGEPYGGTNTPTLVITSAATAGMNGYQYRCVVTGACSGQITSNSASLSINIPPFITSQPSAITVCEAGTTTFSVVSPNAVTYQWQVDQGSGFTNLANTAPYSGARTANLKITAATTSMNNYKYRCVVEGTCVPLVNSNPAILTVYGIQATTAQTNVSCNAGSNGTASVSVSGGTGGYSYDWSPGSPAGEGTASASGLIAGLYSVIITDQATGCSITKDFTITEPAALGITPSQSNVSCKGANNGSATVLVSGGTSAYSYSWAPSGGSAATATGLAPGIYTVTVTDANACQTSQTFTITEPAALSLTQSQTNVSCKGGSDGSATVNVSAGGTGGYSYNWLPSGGNAATASGLSAGTYSVTITDGNGCETVKDFTITQPDALTATTTKTDISCNGANDGSATVSAAGGTGPYTYSWAPSGGTAAAAANLAAGTYTVTITDANNCQTSQNVTITEPAALVVTPSQTNVSCNLGTDGSATATVTGGTGIYTYNWAPSGGTGATATGLSAGTYTVTIADGNSCPTTQTFTITQPAALDVISSQTNVSCYGAANGSATVSVSGGTAGYTYNWLPSGGSSATASGLAAGSYTVTITDGSGCESTRNFTITEPSAFTAVLSAQTNVSASGGTDGSATVSVSGGTAPYSYSWTPSGGTAATANGLASGNYTCTVTDALGCTASVSLTITEVPVLTGFADIAVNYGDTPFTITAPASQSSGSFTYSSSNAQVATISGNTLTVRGAGTSTISVNQAASGKYAEASASAVLTVSPKNITLNLNASPLISKTYDGTTAADLAQANYLLNGLVAGDEVSVSGTAVYNTANAGVAKAVSVANLVLAGAQKENYVLTTSSAVTTGNIIRKDIRLTLNTDPLISKVYDGTQAAALAPANYSLSVLIANDDVTVSGTATYDSKSAGTGKIVTVSTLVLSGAQKDNYNLVSSSASTSGTISPKMISAGAAAISKVYDGTTAATLSFNSFTAADGLLGSDDLRVSYTAASYADKNAGTAKSITLTGLELDGTDKGNYTLNPFTATGDISTMPVSVTANDGVKIYGQNDPALSYNITAGSLAAGDTFTGGLTRLAGEAVGTYPVSQGSLALSANYVLSFSGSNLQISKKELLISADNKTRFFGSSNPELTLSWTGFVNGENQAVLTQQPTVSSSAAVSSALGEYPIIVSGASAANYSIVYQNGTLKVIPGVPTDIVLAAARLLENRPAGTAAGILSSTSDDSNATFSFSMVSGTGDADNSLFIISGNELKTTASLDFDSKSAYSIRVRSTTQHGFTFEKVISVAVTDVNEIPTLDALADQVVCYTSSPLALAITGVSAGPEGSRQTTVLTAVSSNSSLFSELKVSGGNILYQIAKGQSGTTTITLTVKDNGGTNDGGVDSYSRTFNLTVKKPLEITISSDKGEAIPKGETVHLTATGGIRYSWANANGIISGQETATLSARPSETTTYRVTVTNSEGCDDIREMTIETSEDFRLVKGANILTPNGDGVNDRLVISNIDMYPNSVLKIFDRAGRLLYSKTNYANDWDGTYQGSALAEETYYYIVDFGAGRLKQKGFITIIRD